MAIVAIRSAPMLLGPLAKRVAAQNASAGNRAKYEHSKAINESDAISGMPPKVAIDTCTQLIPAPNQPKPNIKPYLAALFACVLPVLFGLIQKIMAAMLKNAMGQIW